MRDKLIELLQGMHNAVCDAAVGWLDSASSSYADQLNVEADYLIAHGVTFAKDNNVTCKKPVLYNVERGALCPACDRELDLKVTVKRLLRKDSFSLRHKTDFCKYCGQALDWGNEASKEGE